MRAGFDRGGLADSPRGRFYFAFLFLNQGILAEFGFFFNKNSCFVKLSLLFVKSWNFPKISLKSTG